MRTTRYIEGWLQFMQGKKVVAEFGALGGAIPYNRLRELWIHGRIGHEELKARIAAITCPSAS